MKIRKLLKIIVGKLIEKTERWELRHTDIGDENDISKKIIDTVPTPDLSVSSDSGMVPVTEIHRTRPFTVYVVTLDDGTELECADRHIVYRMDDLSAAGLPE